MPFEIVRNDIVNMRVDAIVNTANPLPVIGSGADCAIHAKAGPKLLEARKKIGNISVGCAAITPGFALDAAYVIHAVGPRWMGGFFGEAKQLRTCYDSALALAAKHGCRSIAFPLISTGNYRFPKDQALRIAISAFSEFLMEQEMQIYLVVFSQDAYRLSEKLFRGVESYIDEHYVAHREQEEYFGSCTRLPQPDRRRNFEAVSERWIREETAIPCPMQAPLSLEEILKQEDAGFTEKLLELIDASGKKDAEIYKKANLSKQHFSKIRNDPNYKPKKPTAIALALALELDLEETRDLIGRAGYALTNSSKFDLIIRYFIERKNYNVVEINMALYEFDQNLLGA